MKPMRSSKICENINEEEMTCLLTATETNIEYVVHEKNKVVAQLKSNLVTQV